MSNLDKKNENSSNTLPFSLNWKDMLMIGLFLVGAGGIIYSIRETDKTAENGVSTNLIEKVENQQLAEVENPVKSETNTTQETAQPATTAATNNTQTTETRQIPEQSKKVESPLSNIDAKNAGKTTAKEVAATDEMTAKSIDAAAKTTAPTKTERGLILATDVKARTGAPVVAPKVETKPAAYSPSKTAGTGNFFLIAASRSNMEEAMKAVEDLKKQGFAKPVILEPSKEAGTTNFRIAVYRDNERAKVDEYTSANADKTKGYWVWHKK